MPKLFIVEMSDNCILKGKVRFKAVDLRDLKEVKEVPEITGTCVDAAGLMKMVKGGVKFYQVEPS